ncbi:hypothetical protein H2200_004040 [Cladophialophora chaetospira]|uniref:DUF1742-domain-containing protein n=1 Tax=Cladophialophora chaetospira TaxID=386627 RepID=A0AA38XFC8_9EURO|nr:hypothetical protein H2200_004040 [Cladophialophora chaetospira]
MITPDNKDFLYICVSHLSDRGFASPVVDAGEEAAKKKKELLDIEIEKIKQEYEEKQRKKKAKRKAKDDDKDKKKADEDDDKAEKERDDKIKALQTNANGNNKTEDIPRIYALHRNFFQMRVDRVRNLEIAKRNQQRIKDPTFFPAAPKGDFQ